MTRMILSHLAKAGIVAIKLHAVQSAGDVAFQATMTSVGNDDFVVADDAGKVKTFRDADDVLKQAGAQGMLTDSMSVQVDGLGILAPKPFTGDIIKKNQSTIASYEKRRASMLDRAAKLQTEITLMSSDGTVPQSLKDEKATQLATVNAAAAWLQTEVDRITAIINGAA